MSTEYWYDVYSDMVEEIAERIRSEKYYVMSIHFGMPFDMFHKLPEWSLYVCGQYAAARLENIIPTRDERVSQLVTIPKSSDSQRLLSESSGAHIEEYQDIMMPVLEEYAYRNAQYVCCAHFLDAVNLASPGMITMPPEMGEYALRADHRFTNGA